MTLTKRFYRNQEAFTLVELLMVIVLMALLLAVGTVVYYGASRNTDLKATAEIVKQDIRKVYAMSDSAAGGVVDTQGILRKDEYQIEFHLNGDNPSNCYRVRKRTWAAGGSAPGAWTPLNPADQKHFSNMVITATDGNQWIKASSSPDIRITGVSNAGGANQITFKSQGSIIQTDANGDATLTLHSQSQNRDVVITVSMFGSVE